MSVGRVIVRDMSDVPTVDQAADHVHGICLKTGPPPRRVGVELEWLVRDARDPRLPVPAERIAAAVAGFAATSRGVINGVPLPVQPSPYYLPSGATLTTEPGGQLELSSVAASSLTECVRVTCADMTALRDATATAGLELAGFGIDPLRPPRRILDKPRYAAMEAFFDRDGGWGRQMMCSTASVQVCLDAGDDGDGPTGFRWRWRLLHALGPVLVAAFANSPARAGKPAGWRSARQQVWQHLDPGRTKPLRADADPRKAWADYALDALVMCVPGEESGSWLAPPGLTLRQWLADANSAAGRQVRTSDLTYHLSTLFPPVRPRGHFELRMIDAQPGDGWIVPVAVATALADDPQASRAAMAATAGLSGDHAWARAARLGPADPEISRASRECFKIALDALPRLGATTQITDAVGNFTERYVLNDRCPADDLLEGIT
jgi:ergothioneine biosynthesis glutamate--cysteine ligase EgtA